MKILLSILIICGLQFANANNEEVVLTKNNHCSLQGKVTSESMRSLKSCLAKRVVKRRGSRYPLYLVINSPGGSVYAGLQFISYAKNIRNLQTVTIYAASMGSAIVQALPGKRHGTDNAITMFHRAKGSFSGQFGEGELESKLKLWTRIVLGMETVNAKRIGIPLSDYKKKVVNEYWVYSHDNVKQNTLDTISIVKCSHPLLKVVRKVRVKTMFGTINKTVSGCPILN